MGNLPGLGLLTLVAEVLIVLYTLAVARRRLWPALVLSFVLEAERFVANAWVQRLPVNWPETLTAACGALAGVALGLSIAERLVRRGEAGAARGDQPSPTTSEPPRHGRTAG